MTDEADPMLVFGVTIDQTSFLKLKREQNLLVEFSQLHEKVSSLLDFCIQQAEDQSRFLCVVTENTYQ